MSKIKIGGASLNQTPIDWENNTSNIRQAIQVAINNEIKILCLPELCITAYGCQDIFLHEWVVTKALSVLVTLVDSCKNITVAIGLPIWHNQQLYNTTCIVSNQKIIGFYAKQFLANDGIHYEKRWFSPWPKNTTEQILINDLSYPIGDITCHIDGFHVGFEICEDAWHKTDRPACRLYEKGVNLILNPSASHFSFNKLKLRETLILNSSKRFECYYLYANQLGNESGRVIYDGDILLAHNGNWVFRNRRFSYRSFNLKYAEISLDNTSVIQDFESDYSNSFEEFSSVGSLALFDYLRKSGAKGYSLSLSGGADSSSIAVLVAHMVKLGVAELGVTEFLRKIKLIIDFKDIADENSVKHIVNQLLFTAYQGTENSSDDTLSSAKNLAESLGAQFAQWSIDSIVSTSHDIVEKALDRPLNWKTDDIAMQNIQARTRSPLIWMMANVKQMILLTTSNRSEGDVGYTTMDGDTSGSLAPIAGVDKPFIIQWLKYAEKELGYSGLKFVNQLTPTAELRPKEYTQTDENDLMPYDILVRIEQLGIRDRLSPKVVFLTLLNELPIEKDLLKRHVLKFYRLWSINQWKRERLAPSFHIDDFNVDPKTWCRFPILSGSFKSELKELEII